MPPGFSRNHDPNRAILSFKHAGWSRSHDWGDMGSEVDKASLSYMTASVVKGTNQKAACQDSVIILLFFIFIISSVRCQFDRKASS